MHHTGVIFTPVISVCLFHLLIKMRIRLIRQFFVTVLIIFLIFLFNSFFLQPASRETYQEALLWPSMKTSTETNLLNSQKTDKKSLSEPFKFLIFVRIKKAALSILYKFSSGSSLISSIIHSKIAIEFISKNAVSLELDDNSLLSKLQIIYNTSMFTPENYSRVISAKENDQLTTAIIKNLGHWFVELREHNLQNSHEHRNWCKQNLKLEQENIREEILGLQFGTQCEISKDMIVVPNALSACGFSCTMHRLAHCVHLGLTLKAPCLIDDSKFPYGAGNFRNFFSNSKNCAGIRRKRIIFFSPLLKVEKYRTMGFPALPKNIMEKLKFCHEDLPAWYFGVIHSTLQELSEDTSEKVRQLISSTKIPQNQSFVTVHIRSTDKIFHQTIFHASDYLRYASLASLFFGRNFSEITNYWIATDSQHNVFDFYNQQSAKKVKLYSVSQRTYNELNFATERYLCPLETN